VALVRLQCNLSVNIPANSIAYDRRSIHSFSLNMNSYFKTIFLILISVSHTFRDNRLFEITSSILFEILTASNGAVAKHPRNNK